MLAPIAEMAGEIDVERARRAAETAEAAGAGVRATDGEAGVNVEAEALARAQLRIEVAGT